MRHPLVLPLPTPVMTKDVSTGGTLCRLRIMNLGRILRHLLPLWMLAATAVAQADTTDQRAAADFDAGLKLYWSGDYPASIRKMAAAFDATPLSTVGRRAHYTLNLLLTKMPPTEADRARNKLKQRYPWMATYLALNQRPPTGIPATNLTPWVDFVTTAPTPAWQQLALRSLFELDWPDEVIASQLSAATLLADLAHQQTWQDDPPRLRRLYEQLLKQYRARNDLRQQLTYHERLLFSGSSQEDVTTLFSLRRAALQEDLAHALFTNSLPRVEKPELLALHVIKEYLQDKDLLRARRYLTEAQALLGTTNTSMIIAESLIREANHDFIGAQNLLSGKEDNDLLQALGELQKRLPQRYEMAWKVTVPEAVRLAVNGEGQVFVYCNKPGYTNPPSLARLTPDGQRLSDLFFQPSTNLATRVNFSGNRAFLLLPEHRFLLGNSIYNEDGLEEATLVAGRTQGPTINRAALSPSGDMLLISHQSNPGTLWQLKPGSNLMTQIRSDTIYIRTDFRDVVWNGDGWLIFGAREATKLSASVRPLRRYPYNFINEPYNALQGGWRVCADANGLMYFITPFTYGVAVADSDLNLLCRIGVSAPIDCAPAPDGSVLVLTYNHEVIKFRAIGGGAQALLP